MKYYHPKPLIFFSFLLSCMGAWSMPLYGLIFSKILFTLIVPNRADYSENINFWCGMFLLMAGSYGLVLICHKFC